MKFRDPISAKQREKLNQDPLDATTSLVDVMEGMPWHPLAKPDSAATDFRYAYEQYRLDGCLERVDGKDDQKELNAIVDRIREDFGPKRGEEAVRVIIKGIDNAIDHALGEIGRQA